MTATRRNVVLATGAAVSVAALASCTVPAAVAPKRHAYLLRTINGYRRDLALCNTTGGQLIDLVHGVYGRPAWTRDGSALAVSRGPADDSQGTWALWLVRSDGASLHRITSPASGVADLDPAYSPDGQTIAFSRDTIGFGYGQGLWLIRPQGTGLHPVPGGVGGITPSFSSDGQFITYAAADGIRRIPTVGGAPRLLARGAYSWQLTQPSWSPDGKRIAFVRRDSPTAGSLCYMAGTGGAVSVLTSAPVNIECPTWSTDSATLTYARVDGIGAEGRRTTAVMRQVIGGAAREMFRTTHPAATDLATLA
jgi:Tol biopolymer transport system component